MYPVTASRCSVSYVWSLHCFLFEQLFVGLQHQLHDGLIFLTTSERTDSSCWAKPLSVFRTPAYGALGSHGCQEENDKRFPVI